MDMNVEEIDGVTRITLAGKLDVKGAEAIDLRFTAIAGVRPKVAVDLSAVDFMASMGIRMLVMAGKAAARRSNKLAVFGASEPVAKVITTSGLDQIVLMASDWGTARTILA
jgi:anti-anti-sigma factor